jgi:hypothetical protein
MNHSFDEQPLQEERLFAIAGSISSLGNSPWRLECGMGGLTSCEGLLIVTA